MCIVQCSIGPFFALFEYLLMLWWQASLGFKQDELGKTAATSRVLDDGRQWRVGHIQKVKRGKESALFKKKFVLILVFIFSLFVLY